MAVIMWTVTAVIVVGLVGLIQAQQGTAKTVAEGPVAAASASEPLAAESSSYNRYRSGSGSYGGGVDPRYYDRGDTPHFGLAGFPFGYERRYYGQNVVYDNSLAGFPLNYFNYQQDSYGGGGGSNYNSGSGSSYSKPSYGGSSGYAKPQYRSSAAYTAYPAPMEYGAYMGKPSYNYAAGTGSAGSSSAGGNGYYSLQYGY